MVLVCSFPAAKQDTTFLLRFGTPRTSVWLSNVLSLMVYGIVYLLLSAVVNLIIGAADMGTGCDTVLAQMVAECMDCSVDDVAVFGADTDASPYDSGSYASSTTYITGKAVEKACAELRRSICGVAAELLDCDADKVVFEGRSVRSIESSTYLRSLG